MSEWIQIDEYGDDILERVDLWLSWGASPLTMGISDSFRVTDCWRQPDGEWVHIHDGGIKELNRDFITHFMRRPAGPDGETNY